MDVTIALELALFLFSVAMAAGFVDAIAGGGGLITIPALMAAGLPPVQAIATNKLQSAGGAFSASYYFVSRGAVELKSMKWAIAMTFCGSVAGALLVQWIDAGVLSQVIPFLMIGIVLYFVFAPKIEEDQSKAMTSLVTFSYTVALMIGFYDGFFGPGTGSFLTAAFVSLLGFSITRATAHAKVLNFASNIAALLFFIIGGQVVWMLGLIMLLGQIIGARVGSAMVLTKGQQLIRPMIICVSLIMTIKLLWENYAHLWT